MPPTRTLLGHVGAMLALFFALGRLLGLSCAFLAILAALVQLPVEFLASWNAPGSILEGFRPRFGRVFGRFFGLKIHAKGNLKKIV